MLPPVGLHILVLQTRAWCNSSVLWVDRSDGVELLFRVEDVSV